MRNHLAKTALILLALAVVVTGGCTRRAGAGVSGERVDACTAIRIYNSLDAPNPDDGGSVERYARDFVKVLENVNPRFAYTNPKGDNADVPRPVLDDVETLERRMRVFRDQVVAANKLDDAERRDAALTDAQAELADDPAFVETDRRLQNFLSGECA